MKVNKLQEKALLLPTRPGCYLMKRSDEVLYIGKAKNLRTRVASYFNHSKKPPKTEVLIAHIEAFEFILVASETEALVLENNLIKKYNPKYNIRLRDDKTYPYIVVDFNTPFPRLSYVRKIKRLKNREIFGPFVVGSNISQVLKIITKLFRLRDCSLREFKSRTEACLLYQMKQCSAPCVGLVSESDYAQSLERALSVFRGKGKECLVHLEGKMQEYSDHEEYEQATVLRDSIAVLQKFLSFCQQKNSEKFSGALNVDIISYYQGADEVDISLYIMREGMLIGHKNFHFSLLGGGNFVAEEVLEYIYQYYTESQETLPDIIITPFPVDRNKIFREALFISLQKKIKIVRKIKHFSSLIELTYQNAWECQKIRLNEKSERLMGLDKLKELLDLKKRPVLLECFDIALFQGSSPTASQIVFKNGAPFKKGYRHYHLTEVEEGNNDYKMMRELMTRRMKSPPFPDIFIVDGGKGQISSFTMVLEGLDCKIPVVGIVKSKVKSSYKSQKIAKTQERLILPGEKTPYLLSQDKGIFRIIVQMRDEAHRFSRRLHHKSEKKKLITSWVDEIEGIGPKFRQIILKNQTLPLSEIKKFDEKKLEQYFKIPKFIACKIKKKLNFNDRD